MTHKKIETLSCPNCGGELEKGYIVGHNSRLRWTLKRKTYTIFSGKPLNKKMSYLYAPTVSAMRCENCKLGVFSYDN